MRIWGCESWASNPAEGGRSSYFKNARVLAVEKAGHWMHHDQLEMLLQEARRFLAEP
jgi:pimeloyl-ACP methyl ester carboxylesterase